MDDNDDSDDGGNGGDDPDDVMVINWIIGKINGRTTIQRCQ